MGPGELSENWVLIEKKREKKLGDVFFFIAYSPMYIQISAPLFCYLLSYIMLKKIFFLIIIYVVINQICNDLIFNNCLAILIIQEGLQRLSRRGQARAHQRDWSTHQLCTKKRHYAHTHTTGTKTSRLLSQTKLLPEKYATCVLTQICGVMLERNFVRSLSVQKAKGPPRLWSQQASWHTSHFLTSMRRSKGYELWPWRWTRSRGQIWGRMSCV